jgi:hypothetical protein
MAETFPPPLVLLLTESQINDHTGTRVMLDFQPKTAKHGL